ncbi:WXG100 family type VII secretion target [Microbacterium sp.]|uniref:WXG100 family type VII secretion target n=1 Tax=Microbacterium sp. TaxID=51671 RepID=UPI0039E6EE44
MAHSVRTDHIEQVVDDLERITTALTDALQDAEAASKRLHGVWAGEASQAHDGAHAEWSDEAQVMIQSLVEMRSVLRGAHANYSWAAAANSKMWG